ncbi:MAG TPA: type II secretion system F family protein [Mycobacteriales bacterium]|nr:type II secretion system F family protein [Mycobacteriales bacterium]
MVTPRAVGLVLAGMALLAAPALPAGVPLHRLGGGRNRLGVPRAVLSSRRHPGTSILLAVPVTAAVALLVGMPIGPLAGLLAGWTTVRLCGRLEPAELRRARQERRAELPAVLDLLAVGLSTGLPLESALDLVAGALPGALSADLHTVAELHRLGAGPAVAWNEARADPVLGPVARAAVRSGESGSALALAFDRIAAEHRADGVVRSETAARRAGVWAMAPLGLCFLPAFVCLGVVPVVLGIAHQILGTAVAGASGP